MLHRAIRIYKGERVRRAIAVAAAVAAAALLMLLMLLSMRSAQLCACALFFSAFRLRSGTGPI